MTNALPRILYIDDDDGLRALAKRSLSRRGFDVSLAASGSEGIAQATTEYFDVIAVDHYMPELDGLGTLALLRVLPDPAPVIYVTGSEETAVAVAALKAGAIDYIVKTVGNDFFDLLASACNQAITQVRLAIGKRQAEEALQASNLRLEALLHEVNHRVANSLAIISSFVHMQSRAVSHQEAKDALQDTQRRIQAVAQIHRKLYTSDNVKIVAMDDYLTGLVTELELTWSTPQSPRPMMLTADELCLGTDKAVSVGVIVNELVSNACKYAYKPDEAGEIRIILAADGPDHFLLKIEDDGCGLPLNAIPRGTGLGSRVIAAMAQSLRSTISYDSGHDGLSASLRAAR
ncbi:MAG: two-component system sensor histidine kinase/response regulator [Sphingomonadales bacterium]|nr:two-component system sensor histidine kinase/response regulator [Sphingomonadales bacterium]